MDLPLDMSFIVLLDGQQPVICRNALHCILHADQTPVLLKSGVCRVVISVVNDHIATILLMSIFLPPEYRAS